MKNNLEQMERYCSPNTLNLLRKKVKNESDILLHLQSSSYQLEEAIVKYKKFLGKLSKNAKLSVLKHVKKLGGQVIRLGDELLKDL